MGNSIAIHGEISNNNIPEEILPCQHSLFPVILPPLLAAAYFIVPLYDDPQGVACRAFDEPQKAYS